MLGKVKNASKVKKKKKLTKLKVSNFELFFLAAPLDMRDLTIPQPGIEPAPPEVEGPALTTEPSGKSKS